MTPRERMVRELNRLCKWRMFFVGWQLGTRPNNDPEAMALRDLRDAVMILRCEVTALTGLLLKYGVMNEDQLADAIATEAVELEKGYQRQYPGIKATDTGLTMTREAAETMRRLHFKP